MSNFIIKLNNDQQTALQKQHNLLFYKKNYGYILQQLQLNIHCQLTRKLIVHPCRTKKCKPSCINQLAILQESKICACGKQVDQSNGIVTDQNMEVLIQEIKKNLNEKVNKIKCAIWNVQKKEIIIEY